MTTKATEQVLGRLTKLYAALNDEHERLVRHLHRLEARMDEETADPVDYADEACWSVLNAQCDMVEGYLVSVGDALALADLRDVMTGSMPAVLRRISRIADGQDP